MKMCGIKWGLAIISVLSFVGFGSVVVLASTNTGGAQMSTTPEPEVSTATLIVADPLSGVASGSNTWFFEILSILFIGIMLLISGRILREHWRDRQSGIEASQPLLGVKVA